MLYLDNAATTKVLEDVKNEMIKYLSEEYGNSEVDFYNLGINAKNAIDKAKKQISDLIKCDKDEIIFTSGATESNNLIIKGIANFYKDHGNHLITTRTEHSSVMNVFKYLETKGFEVTYLDVDKFGRININDLMKSIKSNTILISIIWGNNELGSLNNIKEISDRLYDYCQFNNKSIFFHSDATQVIGKLKFDLSDYKGLDFISFSSHKMHGPKGIGAAIIKKDKDGIKPFLEPLIHGGGQQNNYRSGTEPVHQIVGFGKACEIALKNIDKNIQNLNNLENELVKILKKVFSGKINLIFNSDNHDKIPGIINVQFEGIKNKKLLEFFNSHNIYASSGSACSIRKPSHVLQAIGKSQSQIEESVRFSISAYEKIENLSIINNVFTRNDG